MEICHGVGRWDGWAESVAMESDIDPGVRVGGASIGQRAGRGCGRR